MTEEITQSEINTALAQGRFQGEVLGSLNDIKATVGEFKQSFKSHLADDVKEFKDIEIKLDQIKRFMWMISGGLVVVQALATYFFNK